MNPKRSLEENAHELAVLAIEEPIKLRMKDGRTVIISSLANDAVSDELKAIQKASASERDLILRNGELCNSCLMTVWTKKRRISFVFINSPLSFERPQIEWVIEQAITSDPKTLLEDADGAVYRRAAWPRSHRNFGVLVSAAKKNENPHISALLNLQ